MDPISAVIEAGVAVGAAEAAGTVATVAAEAIEVLPNPIAAAEVSKLATRAAESTEILSGKNAIESLANNLPDNLGIPVEVPKVEIPRNTSKLTVDQELISMTETETSLQKWDLEHSKPDAISNPEGYRKWCEAREVAEIDYITESKTELLMEDWDKRNPEPDKAKEPEKHKEWETKRAEQKGKTEEKIRKETKNLKEGQKAEVLAKIQRLKNLYSESMNIAEGIGAIKRQPEQTDQDKKDLAKFRVRKSEVDNEIKMLENDLKAQAKRASPLVALMIVTAVASMAVYKVGQQEGAL